MSLQSSVLDHKGVNTFQQAAINLSSSPLPVRWGQASLCGGHSRHGLLDSWARISPSLAPSCISCAEFCSLGVGVGHRGWFAHISPRPGGVGGGSDVS